MPSPKRCPADPEETAEAYLLGNMPADEERAFENHCTAILRRYWSVRARHGEIAQVKPNAAVVGVLIGLVLILLLMILACLR
jgi:hypothetical protein